MTDDDSKLMNLTPKDSIHLRDAEGWLLLGNFSEARHAIESIDSSPGIHPQVLSVLVRICLGEDKLDLAIKTSIQFTESFPSSPEGWFCLALAFATRDGEEHLLFPDEPTPAGEALKKCFAAAKIEDDLERWQQVLISNRVLDGHWSCDQFDDCPSVNSGVSAECFQKAARRAASERWACCARAGRSNKAPHRCQPHVARRR